MALIPLSKSVISLTKPLFQRKYIKLGKIYDYWPQIIGDAFAEKALPVALQTKQIRQKHTQNNSYQTTLHIMTDGATALPLSYQKDIILARLEHFFGERLITDIKIIQNHITQKSSKHKRQKLTPTEQQELLNLVENISDDQLREKLRLFGESLFQKEHT